MVIAAETDRCCGGRKDDARIGDQGPAGPLHVTKEAEIDELFDLVMKEFGRLDILVNNSGASWGAPSLEYPRDGWDKR